MTDREERERLVEETVEELANNLFRPWTKSDWEETRQLLRDFYDKATKDEKIATLEEWIPELDHKDMKPPCRCSCARCDMEIQLRELEARP